MDVVVKLPYEMIEEIVLKNLVQDYRYQETDANLPKAGTLPHKLEDRKHALKIRKALLKVIRFYTTADQFKALNLDS